MMCNTFVRLQGKLCYYIFIFALFYFYFTFWVKIHVYFHHFPQSKTWILFRFLSLWFYRNQVLLTPLASVTIKKICCRWKKIMKTNSLVFEWLVHQPFFLQYNSPPLIRPLSPKIVPLIRPDVRCTEVVKHK